MTTHSTLPPPILLPDDDHDRRLLANVHPPDWRNPEGGGRYQLVVIGGGTGGLVTAAIGVALGARVALVERALLGGDCLNVGCVPSKALLAAARRAGTQGAGGFAAAMEEVRRLRAGISEHDSASRFRGLGVDVFFGQATFVSADAVAVDGRILRFRRAVIAAGTHPSVPAIPGLADAGFLTNETIFSLTVLPRRFVVIGAGPIGCELAQAFARLGSRVTLVEAADRILPGDDEDAAAVVRDALRRDGIEIVCGATATGVESTASRRTLLIEVPGGPRALEADEILVAVGRTPNTDGLGLDAGGIEHDATHGIRVDDRLRTTNRRVYAVGDVASPLRFTHVADAHARLVVRNALFMGRGSVRDLVVPWCTYTSPELAHVGLSAAELRRQGAGVESITVPFESVDRARLEVETEGFLRLHLRAGTDELVAATVVGAHAGELIAPVAQAMTAGIGLGKLGEVILPYPTRAEALRKAADQWRRRKLTRRAEGALRAWFRFTR